MATRRWNESNLSDREAMANLAASDAEALPLILEAERPVPLWLRIYRWIDGILDELIA